MRTWVLGLLIALAGCGKGSGVVQLTVDATSPVDNVARLRIRVVNQANMVADVDYPVAPARTVSKAMPAILTLNVPSDQSGAAAVTVTALDGAMRAIAVGSATVTLKPSEVVTATVTLTGGAPQPDMATSLDLRMPDLDQPDLIMPDLATPDLATPDLRMPDLQMPDLQMPDLTPLPDLTPAGDMLMCGNNLSNIGTGDFTIGFVVRLVQGANGRIALVGQRSMCASQDLWEVRANGGVLDIEVLNAGGNPTAISTKKNLLNNAPHDILLTRRNQVLTAMVDGAVEGSMPCAVSFGALPALLTGTSPCVGVDNTVVLGNLGNVSGVCAFGKAPPTVVSLSPTKGPTSGGAALMVNGSNFANGTTVTVAGLPATMVNVVNANQISCVTPANLGRPGKVDVVVKNLDGQLATLAKSYTYYFGTLSFAPHTDYVVDVQPQVIVLAHMNKDQFLDVVTLHRTAGTYAINLGKGDGTFGAASKYSIGGGTGAGLAVADFNNDTVLDLATIWVNGAQGGLSVALGNGDGTLKAAVTTSIPNAIRLAAGDLNGDGKQDLAIGFHTVNFRGVQTMLGAGNGTFASSPTVSTAEDVNAISVVDLSGDGKLDVVAALGTSLLVYTGKGDGSLNAGVSSMFGGTVLPVPAFGDLNGDAKLDVLVATFTNGGVNVLLGAGNGALGPFSLIANASNGSGGTEARDFDGDGVLDLLVSNFGNDTASILVGKGDGTFLGATSFATSARPAYVASGDVNGDGLLDFVTQNETKNDFSVLLNTSK